MPFYIRISGLSYYFANGNCLFKDLNLNIPAEKTGLTGPNGCGKSTLLKILAGRLRQSAGSVEINGTIALFEQDKFAKGNMDIADILGAKEKLASLDRILSGNGAEQDYLTLDNDWNLEEKIIKALSASGLQYLALNRKFSSLSGGEGGRLLLASCFFKNASFILLDEPTNHLDSPSRNALYEMVEQYNGGILVVSHDRQLLRKMDRIVELNEKGLSAYGGNYDFYVEKKAEMLSAAGQKLANAQSELKKQLKISAAAVSSKERKNSISESRRQDGGIIKAVLNKRRGNAERTLARLTNIHEQKISNISARVTELKDAIPDDKNIKLDLYPPYSFKIKTLVTANGVNYDFGSGPLWPDGLTFEIRTGDRVYIQGGNGSGKTTLVNLILQKLFPSSGKLKVNCGKTGFIDQKYELINYNLTLLENISRFAPPGMPEHEMRIRLSRFLFYNDDAYKKAGNLSGGEKCRLAMACLLATSNSPDMIVLDEPTNNLDLQSVEQMRQALSSYPGAIIIITHDRDFAESLAPQKIIDLDF
jgi:ATPase subunit of ABC transporter with duplicated ATPase domains